MKDSIKQLHWLLLLVTLCTQCQALQPPITSFAQTLEHSSIYIKADHQSIAPGQKVNFDFNLVAAPGWHTYWENPGDSGMPLKIKWDLPGDISINPIQFFPPEQIAVPPLMNYGYHGNAHHLVSLQVHENYQGRTLPIAGTAEWLVCEKICVPQTARFEMMLSVDKPIRSNYANKIDNLIDKLAAIPHVNMAVLQHNPLQLQFELPTINQEPLQSAYVFIAQEQIANPTAKQDCDLTNNILTCRFPFNIKLDKQLSGYVAIKINDEVQHFHFAHIPSPSTSSTSLWLALLFAALGGLLLNLMPCVFPVLSLKVLHLVHLSKSSVVQAKKYALLYFTGVLSAFAIMAIIIIGFKQLGTEIGWGFQLQQPWFLLMLIVVLYLVGFNLIGAFELPGFHFNLESRKSSTTEPLILGLLATVLATPCTAPFMITAISYGLTQPSLITFMILLSLGTGFALPFVILGFKPHYLTWLPKPGNWMLIFKQFLAFPIFLTTIWLLWIFTKLTSADLLGLVLLLLVGISFSIWWLQKNNHGVVKTLVITMLATLMLFIIQYQTPTKPQFNNQTALQRVHTLEASHQPMFVYVTADWCITCKVNEKLVLNTKTMKQFFKTNNIQVITLDWTAKDQTVFQYMQKFNHGGVPLYVVYDKNKTPQVLPQVLTVNMVKSSFNN